MSDIENLLDNLTKETHAALLRAVGATSPQLEKQSISNLNEQFQGCCGLAQCIAGYALQDMGIKVCPVATQSLDGYWQGHAALSLEIADHQKTWLFLIDPTFCQFCSTIPEKEPRGPAYYLQQNEAGREMMCDLLERGYTELNPENSRLYLSAFCEGQTMLNESQSFAFLRNPPPHPFHFRRDEGCDDFSRENLAKRDLLIKSAPLARKGLQPS